MGNSFRMDCDLDKKNLIDFPIFMNTAQMAVQVYFIFFILSHIEIIEKALNLNLNLN